MTRRRKRQEELNEYVIAELKELRYLIQQSNSDHARERDSLLREVEAYGRTLDARTGQTTGRGNTE